VVIEFHAVGRAVGSLRESGQGFALTAAGVQQAGMFLDIEKLP
jgi:hypothetical protein